MDHRAVADDAPPEIVTPASRLVIRPATKADIDAVVELANKPSIRAWVAEIDGRILGMAGIFRHDGRWYGYADMTDEIRGHKMALGRAARRFLAGVDRDGIKYIYAEASPTQPRAVAWLESLGFRIDARGGHYYRWRADDWRSRHDKSRTA